MIPYIIINGVSSRTIHGLLIQSLPPISKPRIKTSIEEIDGRDGDIVTTLGYAAYDKPMTIGLKGDYDIDEIIKRNTNLHSAHLGNGVVAVIAVAEGNDTRRNVVVYRFTAGRVDKINRLNIGRCAVVV
jgi:hypothetical protein